MASGQLRVILLLIFGAMCGAGGFWAGYEWRDSLTRTESVTPAAERRIDDGAVVLERSPRGTAAERELPPVPIPDGATAERRVRVIIQPIPVPVECPQPPKCIVDLALIREGDGRRVVATSPTGAILGGLDVPLIPLELPAQARWAAGVSYNPFEGAAGAWLERDVGPAVLGLDVYQRRIDGREPDLAARIRVGWRF